MTQKQIIKVCFSCALIASVVCFHNSEQRLENGNKFYSLCRCVHIFPPVFPKYFLDFSSLQCQCFFINCLQCINLSTLFVYVSLYSLRILFPDLNTWNETEIGLGLTAFGVFFSFLGIIFLFDKGLLAMGNVSGDALKKQLCSFSFLLPSYCNCNHVRTLTWAFCVILIRSSSCQG